MSETFQQAINQVMLYRWRAAAYFFTALFMTLGSALSTSTETTDWRGWVVALILALGQGWASLKALFDQSVEEPKKKKTNETHS